MHTTWLAVHRPSVYTTDSSKMTENKTKPITRQTTSSSLSLWIRGVNRKLSISTANGGCQFCTHTQTQMSLTDMAKIRNFCKGVSPKNSLKNNWFHLPTSSWAKLNVWDLVNCQSTASVEWVESFHIRLGDMGTTERCPCSIQSKTPAANAFMQYGPKM